MPKYTNAMDNEEMFTVDQLFQDVGIPNSPKGKKTGFRSNIAGRSVANDVLYGDVNRTYTPTGLPTVKARRHNADERARFKKYCNRNPEAKPILRFIHGDITFTEAISNIRSDHAKHVAIAFVAGGVCVIVLGGCITYFTSDETKAKREEKRTERYIKQLEKAGYIVVPPDDIDFEF